MNQEKKYYTPEIEEFHVGFEYESKTKPSNDWRPRITNIYRDNIILNDALNGKCELEVRVKYLDQADIEELGWQIRKEAEGTNPYLYRLKPQKLIFPHNPELHTVYLAQTTSSYKRCLIYLQQDSIIGVEKNMPEILLFNGIIKNKSELKRLMKQLGI